MEKFEQRLKDDASRIRAIVTPELDDRIRASLESTAPVRPEPERPARQGGFWLLSSLTGASAALVAIVVLNTGDAPDPRPAAVAEVPALSMPRLDVRPAMLEPLETEFENLKGDLEKAERAVRRDIDRFLGEPED